MTTFNHVKFGDGLTVTDEGSGVIRVDATAGSGSPGATGPQGPPGAVTIPFSIYGALAVANGALPWDVLDPGTIAKFQASVGVAPTGSSLGVRLMKNGASIATLSILTATTKASSTPALSIVAGDRLTVDVTSVGSTTPGSHLVVLVQVA